MSREFHLTDTFVSSYKETNPNWSPLGEFTYYRTYSRVIENDHDRNEMWWETVQRVVEGIFNVQKEHCDKLKLPWKGAKAQRSAQIMFDKIFNFRFTPSGRGLWMMGSDFLFERGTGMPLLNCAFVSTSDIDTRGAFAFQWTMDALMLGLGVGFDVMGADKIKIREPRGEMTYQIPDSREGWVESLGMVLEAYFYGKKLPTFNYELIRPYGVPIRGFGGTASGPEPLIELHQITAALLKKRVGEMLTSVDIVDLMNLIGKCVVAGNVRRSSEIALGNYDDEGYITMKDSNLYPEELQHHRWASNNSIFAEVGQTDYSRFVDQIKLNGEPGIIWLDNMRKYGRLNDPPTYADQFVQGINPCGEIPLESTECCNLVETFPSRHDNYEEYVETLKYAYLFAKSVTLLPTHWPETNAVMMKNRRIGTSQSGIIDAFQKHGRRNMLEWSDNGYHYLRELDDIYSNWLCIPRSVKVTTVKPSGTVSLLPGVSPGVHYPHDEFYIRRVRLATSSPLVDIAKKAGFPVELSKYGSKTDQARTSVISFPVKQPFFDRKKEDVSIWEQVKNVVDYQRYWADNSVSITVTFKAEEADEIPKVLEAYEDQLKSISFLPLSDHGYVQAPYESIDEKTYKAMMKGTKTMDFSGLVAPPEGERYCNGDTCLIDTPPDKR